MGARRQEKMLWLEGTVCVKARREESVRGSTIHLCRLSMCEAGGGEE